MTIAYDGTHYVGWQVQTNGVSVQQRLEEAWHTVTGESIRITGSGRTDSGVHARGQVSSCHTETNLAPDTLRRALNARTPEDITVTLVERARDDFHAIRDAVKKTYQYQIQYGRLRFPLEQSMHWFVGGNLDIERIRQTAVHFVGRHDFSSFESAGSPRNTTVRNVSQLDIITRREDPFDFLLIEISADGFLYNMVRNIVGFLVEVGQGRHSPDDVPAILARKDRGAAGITAPARGLCLLKVDYSPDHLYVAPLPTENRGVAD